MPLVMRVHELPNVGIGCGPFRGEQVANGEETQIGRERGHRPKPDIRRDLYELPRGERCHGLLVVGTVNDSFEAKYATVLLEIGRAQRNPLGR